MIVIVYPQFYGVGGIARYLDSFLDNLAVDHPRIALITGEQHRVDRQYANVDIIHVPLPRGRFGLILWGLAVRSRLRQLNDRHRIHYINLHWPPLLSALFLPPEIPLVLTAHTTYLGMSGRFDKETHFKSQWNAVSLAIKMQIEKKIFGQAQKVITLTEQGRQEVFRYGFSGPVIVIPNGADTLKFKPDRAVKKDIDVLFSGRIERRKGSLALVELCRKLISAKPDIKICIVGYGEDEQWVAKSLIAFSENILMTGKIPFEEMAAYYNRSRIYASTSYYEGLPGTCLEAMAMELPVVVWDFLFYQELVIQDKTGCLVTPNDFEKMVKSILLLLSDRGYAGKLGTNGRNLLESNYSWSKLTLEISNVFKI